MELDDAIRLLVGLSW